MSDNLPDISHRPARGGSALRETPLDRLRPRHLDLLAALDRHGSLRRAAAGMGLTQPAATKLLRGLEETVGRTLFVRSPRGLVPNPFGEVLLRQARTAAEGWSRAQREMEAIADGGPRRVTVGAVHSAAPFLMARAIAQLKREWPSLTLRVTIDTSNNLLPLLRAGELDLLVARPWEVETGDVVYEELIDEHLVVVGRAGHPLAGVADLSLRDLVDRPFALLPAGSPMRRVIAPLFREGGVDAPADLVETASILTIVALLGESDTLAILPEEVARFYESQGTLVRLSPALPAVMGAYGIVTRRGITAPVSADRFLQILRSIIRQSISDYDEKKKIQKNI